MEMVLKNASAKDLAQKIKEDKSWLNQERMEYIVQNRTEIFKYLAPSDVNTEIIKVALKNKDILSEMVSNLHDSKQWKEIIGESIPRPLTSDIFENYGLTLSFLDDKEYGELAKQWLEKITPNKHIPVKVQKFLSAEKVLDLFEDDLARDLQYEYLSKEAQTADVALWFLSKSYNPEKFYNQLSDEIKADIDVSDMLCKKNKQLYKIIPPQHQSDEEIIKHVINNIKYSGCDTVADSDDYTAILTNELPLHAVREINDIGLIEKVLKNNPKFYTDAQVQFKWFRDDRNKAILADYLSFFPKKSDEDLTKELRDKSIGDQISMIEKNNSLAKLIIDTNDIKKSLTFLYSYHGSDFNKDIQVLGLTDMVNNNLDPLVDVYSKFHSVDNRISHEKSLRLGIWLFKKNTKEHNLAGCKLISNLLNFKPDILESNMDYLYSLNQEEYYLRKNSMMIYEYMDANPKQIPQVVTAPKPKKKI